MIQHLTALTSKIVEKTPNLDRFFQQFTKNLMNTDLYMKTEDMVTHKPKLDHAKFGKVLTYFDRFIDNLSGPVFFRITQFNQYLKFKIFISGKMYHHIFQKIIVRLLINAKRYANKMV